jgi:hypothetical protein
MRISFDTERQVRGDHRAHAGQRRHREHDALGDHQLDHRHRREHELGDHQGHAGTTTSATAVS